MHYPFFKPSYFQVYQECFINATHPLCSMIDTVKRQPSGQYHRSSTIRQHSNQILALFINMLRTVIRFYYRTNPRCWLPNRSQLVKRHSVFTVIHHSSLHANGDRQMPNTTTTALWHLPAIASNTLISSVHFMHVTRGFLSAHKPLQSLHYIYRSTKDTKTLRMHQLDSSKSWPWVVEFPLLTIWLPACLRSFCMHKGINQLTISRPVRNTQHKSNQQGVIFASPRKQHHWCYHRHITWQYARLRVLLDIHVSSCLQSSRCISLLLAFAY